ncbi:hypothetical protein ACHAXT_002774 [Thalassiosira profunda]
MEAFFGGDAPVDGSSSRRDIRRGVWSTSLEEEDAWINALLSLSARHDDIPDDPGGEADTSQLCDKSAEDTPKIARTEIPKRIHFIWLGGKAVPSFPFLDASTSRDDEDCNCNRWNECMHSWKEHHPASRGWTIHLWTEQHIVDGRGGDDTQPTPFALQLSDMHNSDGYLYAIENELYGMASDILRLEILNKFGGVYVDIDYWCVGSLDDIATPTTRDSVQFFCGASNTGCIELNNGLMACRKGGHPILSTMIDSLHEYFGGILASQTAQQQNPISSLLSSFLDTTSANALELTQSSTTTVSPMDVIRETGPGLLTRSVCRWLVSNSSGSDESNVSQVAVFPSCTFHPFPNHLRHTLASANADSNGTDSSGPLCSLDAFVVPNVTKAVHLWGCSWQKS